MQMKEFVVHVREHWYWSLIYLFYDILHWKQYDFVRSEVSTVRDAQLSVETVRSLCVNESTRVREKINLWEHVDSNFAVRFKNTTLFVNVQAINKTDIIIWYTFTIHCRTSVSNGRCQDTLLCFSVNFQLQDRDLSIFSHSGSFFCNYRILMSSKKKKRKHKMIRNLKYYTKEHILVNFFCVTDDALLLLRSMIILKRERHSLESSFFFFNWRSQDRDRGLSDISMNRFFFIVGFSEIIEWWDHADPKTSGKYENQITDVSHNTIGNLRINFNLRHG